MEIYNWIAKLFFATVYLTGKIYRCYLVPHELVNMLGTTFRSLGITGLYGIRPLSICH